MQVCVRTHAHIHSCVHTHSCTPRPVSSHTRTCIQEYADTQPRAGPCFHGSIRVSMSHTHARSYTCRHHVCTPTHIRMHRPHAVLTCTRAHTSTHVQSHTHTACSHAGMSVHTSFVDVPASSTQACLSTCAHTFLRTHPCAGTRVHTHTRTRACGLANPPSCR